MNLKLEAFGKNHEVYVSTIKKWWFTRRNLVLPTETMSDYGFMVLSDDRPVCAMFFYPTIGCDMALLGWPIASVETDVGMRKQALELLVAACENLAKTLGYKVLVSYASTGAMKENMATFGYLVGDTNCDNYIKVLR